MNAVLGSERVKKSGQTRNGQHRYKCRECGRSLRESPQPKIYTEEEILHAYAERTSLRGLTRIFGVSRQTVTAWLKKAKSLPEKRNHPLSWRPLWPRTKRAT